MIFHARQADASDTGMPQEWQKILDDNGITKAEQEQNPDEVSWWLACLKIKSLQLTLYADPSRRALLPR